MGALGFEGLDKLFNVSGEVFLSCPVLVDLFNALVVELGDLVELCLGGCIFLQREGFILLAPPKLLKGQQHPPL